MFFPIISTIMAAIAKKKQKEEDYQPSSLKIPQRIMEIQRNSESYKKEVSKDGIIYILKMEIVDLKKKINYDENLRGMIHDLDAESVRLKIRIQDLENENKETTKLWESSTTDNINLRDELEKLNEGNAIIHKNFQDSEDREIALGIENKKLKEGVRVPREKDISKEAGEVIEDKFMDMISETQEDINLLEVPNNKKSDAFFDLYKQKQDIKETKQ